ncbi:anti-sigma factor family protein [Paraburkholderia megapolitana]|uniref:anti-sigma factor family protein n=1 Tax=Paraburkholderia megapolitana TaxID=420953 RepID=UPI0038B75678
MDMQTTPFPDPDVLSEADVQAFVDGSLSPERNEQVQRYLRTRPDEARRVGFYERLNREMQQSFEHLDGGAAQPSFATFATFSLIVAGCTGWLRRRARVIVAALLLVLCVAGGWVWATRVPATVLDAGALMVLEHVLQPAGTSTGAAAPLLHTAAPDLSSLGWQPVERSAAQVGPFARANGFIYRNAAGDFAVLLSVRDWSAPAQPQWQARRVGELRLLSWTTAHMRFVLAGRAQMRGLMRAADLMTMR